MLKQLKNKKLKSLIVKILNQSPTSRDSDQKLICNVWHNEFRDRFGKSPEDVDGKQFLTLVANEILSNPESIRRVRQKVQEQQPELRGLKYRMRQNHAKKVRQEINT